MTIKSTKDLIQERDRLKERLVKLDCRIQNRKDRVMNTFIISSLSKTANLIKNKDDYLKFIAQTLRDGEDTSIDNIALNGAYTDSGLEFDMFTSILRELSTAGLLEETVWAWCSGTSKKVSLDKFHHLVSQVELNLEFPYNLATGEDIEHTDVWVSDNYQTIWLPTVKYKEIVAKAYNAFLEESFDDEE